MLYNQACAYGNRGDTEEIFVSNIVAVKQIDLMYYLSCCLCSSLYCRDVLFWTDSKGREYATVCGICKCCGELKCCTVLLE